MNEQKLKDYFENKISSENLSEDLFGSQQKTSYDTTTVFINRIDTEEDYIITKEHLIKICEDGVAKKLSSLDINTISFALISSDFFHWEDEQIAEVIFDFDNPEIGYDINEKNLTLWKEYLLTGEYKLDKNELKEKFRSKGKYKELYLKVDEILWKEWDPLGVNDIAPRDEYQSYTPTIMKLLKSKSSIEKIADELFKIETETMGLTGSKEHCENIAKKINNLV